MTERLGGRFAAAQCLGARENQEDDYGLMDGRDLGLDGSEHTLLIVADGMGGHAGGGTASGLVTEAVVDAYQAESGPISDRLRASVVAANERVRQEIEKKPAMQGMGSTVVAALISKRGLEWVSVGDSPLWLYRDGGLRRLNADHSMAPVFEEMVEAGRMEASQASTDAKRHMLRSAIYGEEVKLIDQSSQPCPVRKDDLLIVASDGVQTLTTTEILEVLQGHRQAPLQEACDALVEAVRAKARPSQDNTTVLLYRPERDWGHNAAGLAAGEIEALDNDSGRPARAGKRPWLLTAVLAFVTIAYVYPRFHSTETAKTPDQATPVADESPTVDSTEPAQGDQGAASAPPDESAVAPSPSKAGKAAPGGEPEMNNEGSGTENINSDASGSSQVPEAPGDSGEPDDDAPEKPDANDPAQSGDSQTNDSETWKISEGPNPGENSEPVPGQAAETRPADTDLEIDDGATDAEGATDD